MKRILKIIIAGLLISSVLIGVLPVFGAGELHEYYETSGDNWVGAGGNDIYAQDFTPDVTHVLTRLDLYLWRYTGYTPGTATISIRATDNTTNGKPTGADLDSTTFDGNALTESTSNWATVAWTTISLTGNVVLSANVTYAILVTSVGDGLLWGTDTAGSYSGGQTWHSLDSGESWTGTGVWVDYDFYFKEFGNYYAPATTATIVTGSAYSSITNGILVSTFSANLTDNGDNRTAQRGIQIGTSTGNYDISKQISQLAQGGTSTDDELMQLYGYVWRGETGEFSIVSRALSTNTTYYYRAYAVTWDIYNNQTYVYGSELSFTTVSYSGLLVPVVQIDGVAITNTKLFVGVTVLSSPSAPLSSVGFRYGTNWSTSESTDNISWFGSMSQSATNTGMYALSTFYDPQNNIREGIRVFVQATAQDSLGNIGYSTIQSVVRPIASIGTGGLSVAITDIDVVGTTATVTATITNPASTPVTAWKLTWAETSWANNPQLVQLQLSSTPTTLRYAISNLATTAAYVLKIAIYDTVAGEWIWAQESTFSTGSSLPYPIGGLPAVETLAGSNIGTNHFTANGWLSGIGEADVTQIGFAWSYTNTSNFDNWNFSLVSGNFSIGAFSQQLSFSQSTRIYFAAVARNIYGTSYGKVFYANLTGYGGSDNGTSGTTINPIQWLLDWLDGYGLNNPVGKWLLVLVLMIIAGLCFREYKFVLIGIEIIIFGLGLVSGFIEWWIILILAIIATAIMLAISRKTQGG